MPGIKPFQALHYNSEVVGDVHNVMAPPYDVISEEQQNELHNRSPYNFTHIDLAKIEGSDDESNNRYTRSKKVFDEWLSKQVMVKSPEPSIYFYKQEYKILGERHSRLGFVALMELENDEDSKVHPHENTHADAVDDRFELTKALNSNLSPIFVCYSDTQRKVEKIFTKHILTNDPLFELEDGDGVRHRMWTFSDEALIAEIQESIMDQNLFIADGHHRYKVACEYRKTQLQNVSNPTGKEPFNYVMTYFTNLDSKDLQIFPMHRIVTKTTKKLDFLEDFFRIDKVKNKDDLQILLAKAGINEHAFGLYTRDGIKLLRLKNKTLIDKYVKKGSKELKSLDANILKCFILDKVGVKSDSIIYTKDINEVTDMVDAGDAELGFVMNAVKISQLKDIALNGERMPPKTTYFYPKVLSGLTVYNMD